MPRINKVELFVRNPPLSSSDNLLRLTDDLLGRILFSGYLKTNWNTIVGLILVNKTFMGLGKRYIAYVDNRGRPEKCFFLGIGKVAPNLVSLDLGDTNFTCTIELGALLESLRVSLRGRALKSTNVNDAFIVDHICPLSQLRFLNVSKSTTASKVDITDVGGVALGALMQLKWLNISMTNITDATVVHLQRCGVPLEYLALECCTLLTDAAALAIGRFKLHSLDITNCKLISEAGLTSLCTDR